MNTGKENRIGKNRPGAIELMIASGVPSEIARVELNAQWQPVRTGSAFAHALRQLKILRLRSYFNVISRNNFDP